MRFTALATDYDGTIAHDGALEDHTAAALGRLKGSGRKLIMVTGRELDELIAVCPQLGLFDLVVAENGALLYDPSTAAVTAIAPPPSEAFVERLIERGVGPISVGRSIVATWEPHETVVLEVIREMGLELQIIFNKGAVMILPANVNKATGLVFALDKLEMAADAVVGVGDAENDHAFLAMCGCSAAVDNAIPALKETANVVLARARGAGVADLCDAMIADDLAGLLSLEQKKRGTTNAV
ncbi:HAD-superfamily hydrolase, subfamily IIB [Kaistia soli DSM 19436]|uniref:HAD-superfamily hydrolase, subfamily IIB n=1 Tax=Kaistia soli DSM 19436 TaxID=1122133 RepID=A0A1M5I8B2_9HYPH|nr:HAD-superfamily hydrolase, subfamily IIB [Kaistia soli DSM 19436]